MKWMQLRQWYYRLSVVFLIISLAGILSSGLQPSLEFTGGSELVIESIEAQSLDKNKIQEIGQNNQISIQEVSQPAENQLLLHMSTLSEEQKNTLLAKIRENFPQTAFTEVSFQTVGPAFGQDLLFKTAAAAGLAILSILLYLWSQFKDWRYGLAGVLAMLHDTVILIGVFAWLGKLFDVKIDILFVTAVLTILSFSIHDTIVLFDQLRELKKKKRGGEDLIPIANEAVSQTLVRSLNNSFTILIMLGVLIAIGGESLRWFAVALFTGTLVGTYSSTFTALPLYVDLVRWEEK